MTTAPIAPPRPSLGFYRRSRPFERSWLDAGANAADEIARFETDTDIVKVIGEEPSPSGIGVFPNKVWIREGDRLAERPFVSGRLQIDIDRDQLAAICEAHRVRRLAAYGSVTTDYFDLQSSDIDLLVEFSEGYTPSLFDVADLGDALSKEAFDGRDVDLTTFAAARQSVLISHVADEALTLYEDDGEAS